MRNLKFVKTILILLSVFVLGAQGTCSALAVPSSFLSGENLLKTLSLEEDYAVLPSSPDFETAETTNQASLDQVAIRAINPGYTTSAGKNSGELIELINLSDQEIDIGGLAIIYTAKPSTSAVSGKSSVLFNFPAGSRFIGRSILLRYKDAPEAIDGAQDLTYSTSLAMTGSLALVQTEPGADLSQIPANSPLSDFGEEISSVCWLGGEDCLPVFSTTVVSRSYTTILYDEETEEYKHVTDYEPLFDPDNSGLYLPPELPDESAGSSGSASPGSTIPPEESPCFGLEFSEILTYYEESASEQFIEVYNSSKKNINLASCSLRYKKKIYALSDAVKTLRPNAYFAYYPVVTLTKNPSSENLYEIIDDYGNVLDTLSVPHGQKKSTSYALTSSGKNGAKIWQLTYAPTPGKPNIYQEFRTCPAGKIINEATGNCVNAATLKSALKDCGEGKYRNPETGRCKKIDSDDGPAPCKEGYERNPETNRCRKIKQNSGADYPLVPVTDVADGASLVVVIILGALVLIGAVYVLFQFRKEIYYFFRKIFAKLKKH